MHNTIYFVALIVFTCGLFIMLVSDNLIKKIFGLAIFQNSVILFFIALGKVSNGIVPIHSHQSKQVVVASIYSSPLPHVLMLTAIVVGFATMSVGLALIYQIYRKYGTILESKIHNTNQEIL